MSEGSLPLERVRNLIEESRIIRVFRYPDFRLLWFGAFLSFTGSQVTNIAQGYFVYLITHDSFKLSVVRFANSIPVFCFGLFAGGFSDRFDKRTVLIITQVIFAVDSLYLAFSTYANTIQYWQIAAIALANGIVGAVEMPTRQSIVSRVVPTDELAAAVPVNAMTFNVARILGPAIGGVILVKFGVPGCYLLDGVSFMALVWTGFAIKSNLKPLKVDHSPLKDLVFEGALFTFRDRRLRALFILESLTATFGLAYLPLLPAYVASLGLPAKSGLALASIWVGIGALIGLGLCIRVADSQNKGMVIRISMTSMAVGLAVLAWTKSEYVAYPFLGLVGAAAIAQLNTTNALFQILSPDRLRGRVLSMHIWALNGLSPFGVLLSGWLAETKTPSVMNFMGSLSHGIPLAFLFGALCVACGAAAAFLSKEGLSNLFVSATPAESVEVEPV